MKTVFITGTSRGIGKALAQKFLKEGWRAFATSLTGELDYTHKDLIVLNLDITDHEAIKRVSNKMVEEKIKIDVLINNAGVLLDKDDESVEIERLRDTLEVNLFGTIAITQSLLPFINSGGKIINISSSAGQLTRDVTSTRYPGYKISKTALNMFTVTLAKRLESDNITVASVHPGWTKTDMGGSGAEFTPEEAAGYIYDFSQKDVESGKFWFRGERMDW
ncbi:MAG: SDR family NAD(P)-dependent oxidoreductase [Candidatus Pacebacteria bacterium]|nr:SDR family NAD(P)-dependent oxidoreductase [Candidatus Paceibacterota bacterium]